ncbi:MAG: HEAT repeat domain-containing protein [Thermodesulfobacteriota bacterium]
MNQPTDEELKEVIRDFLEMGHVENIISMFKRDPFYYEWTGDILSDDRFNVRLGVSILFEELREIQPELIHLAVPSLLHLIEDSPPHIRGEAVSVLGIIASPESLTAVAALVDDKDPQVAEVARDIMEENQ